MPPPKASDKKRSHLSDKQNTSTIPAAINFYVDWPHGHTNRHGSHSTSERDRDRDRHRGRGHHRKSKSTSRESSSHTGTPTTTTATSETTATTMDSFSMYASEDSRFYGEPHHYVHNRQPKYPSLGPYSGLPAVSYPSHPQYYPGISSHIHRLLDITSSPLIWDVRQLPNSLTVKRSTSHIFGPNALSFPVTSSGTGHIRIISKDFPWSLDLGPKKRALTASEILHGLFDLLQRPFDDAIWGAIDDSKRSVIERAWKRREEGEVIKNVDWLGKRYIFKGFYRDEKFVAKRLVPGTSIVSETWVVSFAKP